MERKWIFFLVTLAFLTNANALSKTTYFFEFKDQDLTSRKQKALDLIQDFGLSIENTSWKLQLGPLQLEALKKTDAFLYLEKDRVNQLIKTPKKSEFSAENKHFFATWNKYWHLNRLNIQKAWETTKGEPSVKVAICDSGIKSDHRELAGKVLPGWNFINNNNDTSPNTNHGTAVSGFVAASETNNYGAYGVAPGVSLLPGKIVTTSGGVPTSAMLGCVRWAADQGAKVINVSMTGVNSNSSATAARYANSKGAVVIWAAGNQNWATRWRDKQEIIAVGATDIEDERYYARVKVDGRWKNYGSNTGSFVDITAPGEDIYTMNRNGNFYRSNGTSYSAPLVSGIAALIYSVNPNLSPREVTDILKQSARDLGNDRFYGAGMADAAEAVRLAKLTL
ncbi:MAG: hypothetical protein CME62_05590 [Halobacteriovoraceae bacterium]|nr:hypothetical protein [Halobacteriovoraceae bacterium]